MTGCLSPKQKTSGSGSWLRGKVAAIGSYHKEPAPRKGNGEKVGTDGCGALTPAGPPTTQLRHWWLRALQWPSSGLESWLCNLNSFTDLEQITSPLCERERMAVAEGLLSGLSEWLDMKAEEQVPGTELSVYHLVIIR